jgi:hypothetical protein
MAGADDFDLKRGGTMRRAESDEERWGRRYLFWPGSYYGLDSSDRVGLQEGPRSANLSDGKEEVTWRRKSEFTRTNCHSFHFVTWRLSQSSHFVGALETETTQESNKSGRGREDMV